jgi:hypothetical protein
MEERIKTLEEVAALKTELPTLQRASPEISTHRIKHNTSALKSNDLEMSLQMSQPCHKKTRTLDYTDLKTLQKLTHFPKQKLASHSPKMRTSFYIRQSYYKPPPNFFASPVAAMASRNRKYSHNAH